MSQPARRRKVVDNDGWTHITSTKKSSSRHRPPQPKDQLAPAEIPDGLTFEKLKDKYDWHKQQWMESHSWTVLKGLLEQEIARVSGKIRNCVCFGLGSPSGFSRGGWVDRRSISMFQLAALELTVELLSQAKIINPDNLYAQDPVFNDMDKKLLKYAGFNVVQDPDAFALVAKETFLYAPGAEKSHLIDLLLRDPGLFFGSTFDDIHSATTEGDTCAQFVGRRRSLLLPEFEPNPSAFWRTTLYWNGEAHLPPSAD
ncbi:uncharacterized protein CIMG_06743 [Coccidioides immitis RS]|uniref:SRR1-like domain-containing protein n=3 Tax=Coccidioides immitis TaxID=5501 RepID=J3K8T5_COCIM|nr:uncharacterized protein CIMG_06743 [Coccidioides immitis RS]EAS31264.3 hypothetical protein CIMG_06743 [Coccidioides immitis RS]KMP03885.1 hypothetical protein CIRG_03577 [Coccidioides immitis RMSCC 2394]KMU74866.1 hypothetical protein CISG_00796 [Coccidioides immitis RMSCC 3703]